MKKDRIPELHFYEWRLSAWALSETRDRLDAAGRGIYRELLDACYAQGGFPNDREWIMRRCACSVDEFERCWPTIKRQFRCSRGKLTNVHADIVRREYFNYVTTQREARKNAIEKRKAANDLEKPAPSKPQAAQEHVELANQPNGNGNGNGNDTQANGNGKHPEVDATDVPKCAMSEYEETHSVVAEVDPSADPMFTLRLVQTTLQHALSHGVDCSLVTDHAIAEAVREVAKRKRVNSAGLLLTTVPNVIVNWSRQCQ